MKRAVQLPEVKEGLLRDGFVVAPLGLAEYEACMRAKVQQIQKIAKAANIKLDGWRLTIGPSRNSLPRCKEWYLEVPRPH